MSLDRIDAFLSLKELKGIRKEEQEEKEEETAQQEDKGGGSVTKKVSSTLIFDILGRVFFFSFAN